MAEFAYAAEQTVQSGNPIPLITVIPCSKGYVYHRNGSGIITLRGIVRNANCFARYQVTYNGNISVAEGGTVTPISVAIALDGEPLTTSQAIVTPAAVEDFFNVTSTAIITVPRGCCFNVSVENTSEADGTTPAQAITVANSDLVVTRIA
jgi:hypothetical protein